MFKQVLAQENIAIWPSLALVLFFLVMCGAILWSYRRGSDETYEHLAAIPLNHDTESEASHER